MAAQVIAVVIGLGGLAGVIFTALRFRRDDTATIVQTQSTVLHDMEAITVQLRIERDECREASRGRRPG